MKTAVLISGHTRTLDKCLASQARDIFAPLARLGPVECYCSTVADADSAKTEMLRAVAHFSRVEIEIIPEQPDCIAELRAAGCTLPGSWVKGAPYLGERYPISVHPQAVARQLWQLRRGWQFYESCNPPAIGGEVPECFVRLRPDLEFECLDFGGVPGPRWAWSPWWGRFDGINDRFALLGAQAAEVYFSAYSQIPDLLKSGHALHPETIMRTVLSRGGIGINDRLLAAFSTRRASGELRAPEISASDLCHLAAAARR